MRCHLPPLSVVVATGCLILAFIFQIIGIADTAWGVVDSDNQKGLFRVCVLGRCDTYGFFMLPVEEWLDIVRVFAIMGAVAIFLATVVSAVHFLKYESGKISLFTGVLSGAAALFIIIEFGLYAHENMDSLGQSSGDGGGEITLGHGFILTVIAAVLCCGSTVLYWMASLKN